MQKYQCRRCGAYTHARNRTAAAAQLARSCADQDPAHDPQPVSYDCCRRCDEDSSLERFGVVA